MPKRVLQKSMTILLAVILAFSGCGSSGKAATTQGAGSAVKPIELAATTDRSQPDAAKTGDVVIALQNMVYAHAGASALTERSLNPDFATLSKEEWLNQYQEMLRSWEEAERHANDFAQLVENIPPVQISSLGPQQSRQSVMKDLGSFFAPGLAYGVGDEKEVQLKSPLEFNQNQQIVMVTNALPGGDKLQYTAQHFKTTAQNVKKIMDDHQADMAQKYNMQDKFWQAASVTAQTIETSADVMLFAGDLYTGGAAKFSIAKAGVKEFVKTAVITSISGADLVLQVSETTTQVGALFGSKKAEDAGAWIASARGTMNPLTTLISIKSVAQIKEKGDIPGNLKTIYNWGAYVNNEIQNMEANLIKINDAGKGGVAISGYQTEKLIPQLLDDKEFSLVANKDLFKNATDKIILITFEKTAPQGPSPIGTWEGSVTITDSQFEHYAAVIPESIAAALPKKGQTFPLKLVIPQQDIKYDQNDGYGTILHGTAYGANKVGVPVEVRLDIHGQVHLIGSAYSAGKFNSGIEAKASQKWYGVIEGKSIDGARYDLSIDSFGGLFAGTWKANKVD